MCYEKQFILGQERLGRFLRQVEQGGEVTITRDDRPVALLVPVNSTAPQEARRAAMARIRARAAARQVGFFDWSEWKALRGEGRP